MICKSANYIHYLAFAGYVQKNFRSIYYMEIFQKLYYTDKILWLTANDTLLKTNNDMFSRAVNIHMDLCS